MMTKESNNKKHIGENLRRMLVCVVVLITAILIVPVITCADDEAKTVRVGYYENEVFQEGAAEGKVKTGYI